MSVIAHLENGYSYAQADVDEAWRTLMLAQHHDSWIVPYNGLHRYGTWADAIKRWTDQTNTIADKITEASVRSFDQGNTPVDGQQGYIRVYNTLGIQRTEMMNILLPDEYADDELEVCNWKGKKIGFSIEREGKNKIVFEAEVPPSATPRIVSNKKG